jgi:hypothetical protein
MIKYISILFSLMSALFALSQKPHVELIVQPSNVEVGEPFNVIVKSNLTGEINIEFPANYEQGYNVMNSMEQDFDGNTGDVVTFYFHARTGSISKEGKYTFGPAYVRKGNKVFRSNKVTITANERVSESNESVEISLFRKPACGAILVSKNKVYQGEPVVVEAKVTARFKPTHYDAYRSYSIQSGADQHKINGPQEILVRNENKGNKERFVFELDKQVVFFNNPGRIQIDPFEMTLQSGFDGVQISSKKNYIRVVPLPKNAPNSFIGGVGEFEVTSSFKRSELKQGEVTTFTIIISGKGNLHDVVNPKLSLPPELKMYGDPERVEKFSFTEKGAHGTIQIQYHLQVIKDGDIKFPALAMTYFDPNSEKYITKYGSPSRLIVEKNPSFILANEAISKENNTNQIQNYYSQETTPKSIFSNSTVKWIGISTPFCLAFLFLLFKVKKNKKKQPVISITPEISAKVVERVHPNEWLSILQSNADMGNVVPFFTQLSKNLQNSISQAAYGDLNWVLSREETKDFFNQKQLSSDFQSNFFNLMQTCELCRYGCQTPEEDLNKYLDRAKSIFNTLYNLA